MVGVVNNVWRKEVVSGGWAARGGTDLLCFLGRVVVTLCWDSGLGRALLGPGSFVGRFRFRPCYWVMPGPLMVPLVAISRLGIKTPFLIMSWRLVTWFFSDKTFIDYETSS